MLSHRVRMVINILWFQQAHLAFTLVTDVLGFNMRMLVIAVFFFFGAISVANENIFESELIRIREILQDTSGDRDRCDELSDLVGSQLPLEVCNIIHNSKEINSISVNAGVNFFDGLDLFSYENLLFQYRNKDKENTFFSDWEIDDNFDVKAYPVWDTNGNKSETYTYNIEYDLFGKLDSPFEIKNTRKFIPLFSFNGDYILYGLSKESGFAGLLSSPIEFPGVMIAPSLLDHVDDLLDGLRSKRYFYNHEEEALIYPTSWFYRKKLKDGKVKMNEYGEIIDLHFHKR